jgi:transketolase
MKDSNELKQIARQVRRDILRMVYEAQSGHPGGPLGCADLLTALYFSVLRHKPEKFDMNAHGEDLFFLSNGHLSAGWYSVLARSGYFDTKELSSFRKINSRLQGHPATEEGLPGVRIASGSLGQGLSVACGAALSKKLNADPGLVYCLMGDGEQQEGQVWEAAMFAAGRKIDNLIGMIDYNGQQIDGPVDEIMPLGDLKGKWKKFGWKVIEMDGNDMDKVLEGLSRARDLSGKQQPVMVLVHTDMGYGVDFMMGTHEWHGKPPDDEQYRRAMANFEETLGDY